MKKDYTKKLTEGSPLLLMVQFIVPLLLGLLFQQFYGMVDTIIVGKFLGVDALAGVGSTGSVNFLVLGFCTGICSGFAIPVAQKFGQQDLEGLKRMVGNILWLVSIFALVITLVISLLCEKMLVAMNTPADTFRYAYDYILIIFLGIPATMLYNTLSGIIRSLGDSRTPLYFLIFSSLLNIGLDLALILWAHMGAAGAALATVAAQLVSGILCFLFMLRRFPLLRLSRDDLKLRRYESHLLLSMGVPMGLQYSVTAVGTIIVQTAVNGLGASVMAAITAGSRVFGLLACPLDAIGTAAATFSGQNMGAGKLDRVHRGTVANALIGIFFHVIAFLAVEYLGEEMLMLFLDPAAPNTAEIVPLGRQFLKISVSFYFFLLGVNLFRFNIQGMGFSGYAVIAGVLELLARTVMTVALVPIWGYTIICLANPIAWIMADVFLVPMYFYCMKMLRRRAALAM